MIHNTRLLLPIIIIFLIAGIIPITAGLAEQSTKSYKATKLASTDHLLCQNQTRSFEKALNIPPYLLTAISLVETGRLNKKTNSSFAWPWTIKTRGKNYYMPSKESAISKARLLLANGIKKIDVGCMQINLYYHPKAFEDLNAAFDPEQNVGYAANFLAELNQTTISWPQAAANYHSTTIPKNQIYLTKVLDLWQKISNKSIRNSQFRMSPDPAYSNPISSAAQTAVLKSRFRARLRAERRTNLADKKKQDLEAWRRGRFDKNLYKTGIAVKKAKRVLSDRDFLNQGKKSFSQIRRSQLSEWRKNRNGSAFRK